MRCFGCFLPRATGRVKVAPFDWTRVVGILRIIGDLQVFAADISVAGWPWLLGVESVARTVVERTIAAFIVAEGVDLDDLCWFLQLFRWKQASLHDRVSFCEIFWADESFGESWGVFRDEGEVGVAEVPLWLEGNAHLSAKLSLFNPGRFFSFYLLEFLDDSTLFEKVFEVFWDSDEMILNHFLNIAYSLFYRTSKYRYSYRFFIANSLIWERMLWQVTSPFSFSRERIVLTTYS